MQGGDRQAFQELVDGYGAYLYQAVYGVLRSSKDAEDVTQEVLMTIISSLPQYRYQGFKAWITRIAVNRAIDYKRAMERKREQLTAEWEPLEGRIEATSGSVYNDVETSILSKEKHEHVHRCVDKLPQHYRDVVYAYYMEEKSQKEIAEEQQMPLRTVESKLYRAKQLLRKAWRRDRE
ncbi:RNA polymerase sigma factor [Paenibacillus sp. YYML68]|uniref:RNA polymerase sigma factor n=1 Tax=Paenibacillus sp. YYML68 TaxID=2909250 RepID=UPI00248F5107|nr:RNA polymerase sigma factor [Paenibacillus sp. YYML68]